MNTRQTLRQTSQSNTPAKSLTEATLSEIQHDIMLITGEYSLPRKQLKHQSPLPLFANRPKRAVHYLKSTLDLTSAILGIASFINEVSHLPPAAHKKQKTGDSGLDCFSVTPQPPFITFAVHTGTQLFKENSTAFQAFQAKPDQPTQSTGNSNRHFSLAHFTNKLKKIT